ncbi:MAG TPA: glycosyltransferase, partial [Noviherbaspirillum sp.]|nr:glycosyltransferase [Noviherbaspirillum sp.]
GRLSEEKNFDLLIDVFTRLAPRHPDWDLVILGEGPERAALEGKVGIAGLRRRVFLPGRVGNMGRWYERADLYVMTSRFEGFPNTLVEAMSYGLPAVSFDCDTGPRDIIRPGIDGLLIRPGDLAALEAALGSLMTGTSERQAFARAALCTRERFSVERISSMWEQLFGQCAS